MKTTKTTGKGNAGFNLDVFERLHGKITHWLSDLEFFALEIKFLQHLMAKNTLWLDHADNQKKCIEISSKLNDLELRRELLVKIIRNNLLDIDAAIKNSFAADANMTIEENVKLRMEVTAFSKDSRSLKSKIFRLTEDIAETENLPRLLGR
jgi:hypothetical protein